MKSVNPSNKFFLKDVVYDREMGDAKAKLLDPQKAY